MNAAALLVSAFLGVAVHEAAHALAARAVGLGVMAVLIGGGPTIWQASVGGTQLAIQAIPFNGKTMFGAPSLRWLRTRMLAVVAAGPLSNLVMLLISTAALSGHESVEWLAERPVPVLAFAIANGALLASATIPLPPHTRAGVMSPGSDGWNLLTIAFRAKAQLQPLVEGYTMWAALRLVTSSRGADGMARVEEALRLAPGSTVLRIGYTDMLVQARRWPEAAARLRPLLDDDEVRKTFPTARPTLANNLAWALFMMNDSALLEEADLLSKEALAAASDTPAMHGTRGAVLVALGQFQEAEERLMFAFNRNAPKKESRIQCVPSGHVVCGEGGPRRGGRVVGEGAGARCGVRPAGTGGGGGRWQGGVGWRRSRPAMSDVIS